MNVKYQIFVSSTYEDLKDERNEVIKACLNMGHIPVGMEMFDADDEEQWAVITRTIDQCDYYVVVVAHRYGSTTQDGISFTEKEYDYAMAQGLPVLGFVIDDRAMWPHDRVDKDPAAVEALQAFKSKIKQKMVQFWRDKSELQAHFAISLGTTINLRPQRGWIRAPAATDADIAQALSNLTEENARLRRELDAALPSEQSGDTSSIISALKQLTLKHQAGNEDGESVPGHIAFPLIARGIRHNNPTAHLSQVYSGLPNEVISSFMDELFMMGLVEQQSSIRPIRLTPLGGIIYARLISNG